MDGVRRDLESIPLGPAPPTSAEDASLLEPPADLIPAQQEFWRRWAPFAIEQRTLVPATVAGFRELCEQFVLKAAIARRLQRLGPGSEKALSTMRSYVQLAQRLDSTLARFKLTGFGKPADSGGRARQAATNPWAQVAGK
jgi:phage terminase small subunit